MFKMSAFSVDTGRQTTPPLVDGVVHHRLVQQTMTFITSLATLSLSKKLVNVLYIFFAVTIVQKLLKSVKIWQSCSQMYTSTFCEPRQKCTFWFFQVRCVHKSGDEINFIIVACRISLWLKWYKNYKNLLRLAKVIVKNKMSRFFMVHCVYCVCEMKTLANNSLWGFTLSTFECFTLRLMTFVYLLIVWAALV